MIRVGTIRVGLIGFGMAGRIFHAPLLSSVEGIELAAVVERSSNKAAARYQRIVTYRSLDEMLADSSLDLLVVATPNTTHFELARRILSAGKNLVVDKPLAVRSAQIAELMQLAAEKNLLLAPFHNRRWDGDFRTVQRLLKDGSLGRLVFFESRFDRWRPARPTDRLWKEDPASGGVPQDLGTHLVDQALTLFGKPESVWAEMLREREGTRTNDGFEIRLRYSGFTAALGANCLSLPAGARFRLRGTRGNYVKHGLDPQEEALNLITRIEDSCGNLAWGCEPEPAWGTLYTDDGKEAAACAVEPVAGDYRLYYAGIRDALLTGAAAPAPAIDAWRTARILEWAVESSEQRREIQCDWSDEPEDAQ